MIAKIYCNNQSFETLQFVGVAPISDFKYEEDIPTLIIGKKNAEELFGKENIKVLNKNIKKNLWWTYSKMEKRYENEKDLSSFYEVAIKSMIKNIKYTNVDVYTLTYDNTKKILKYFYNEKKKYCFLNQNHVYFYSNKSVVGVSLSELEYVGLTRDAIKRRIKENSNVTMVINDFFIKNTFKKYLKNNNFLIPYLYSIKNQ